MSESEFSPSISSKESSEIASPNLLLPEEKAYLDTLVNSFWENSSRESALNKEIDSGIISSVARIDLRTAVSLVINEERPQVGPLQIGRFYSTILKNYKGYQNLSH